MGKTSFRKALEARFSVRAHFYLIMIAVFAFGAAVNRLLLSGFGIRDMLIRQMIVYPGTYLFFFLLVRLWIGTVILSSGVEKAIAFEEEPRKDSLIWNGPRSSGWDILQWIPFPEELSIFLLVLAALAIFIWLLVEGPVILVDAAFEGILAGGLASAARKLEADGWSGSVLKRTFLPFFLLFTFMFLFIAMLERACPGASRISEALRACVIH